MAGLAHPRLADVEKLKITAAGDTFLPRGFEFSTSAPKGYTAFVFPAMSSGYDNKDEVYRALVGDSLGTILPVGVAANSPFTQATGDAAAGQTFWVPTAKYSKLTQPFDVNPHVSKGWFSGLRDAVESVAVVAGNYLLPGSSIVTSHIASQDAQKQLSSTIGTVAQIASGWGGGAAGNLSNYAAVVPDPVASAVKGWSDSVSNWWDNLTGTTSPAPLADNQFYGPDGEVITDNFNTSRDWWNTAKSVGSTIKSGVSAVEAVSNASGNIGAGGIPANFNFGNMLGDGAGAGSFGTDFAQSFTDTTPVHATPAQAARSEIASEKASGLTLQTVWPFLLVGAVILFVMVKT